MQLRNAPTVMPDLVRGAASEGLRMLVERDIVDHTFKAVSLRHPNLFDDDVLTAATQRLRNADAGGARP